MLIPFRIPQPEHDVHGTQNWNSGAAKCRQGERGRDCSAYDLYDCENSSGLVVTPIMVHLS